MKIIIGGWHQKIRAQEVAKDEDVWVDFEGSQQDNKLDGGSPEYSHVFGWSGLWASIRGRWTKKWATKEGRKLGGRKVCCVKLSGRWVRSAVSTCPKIWLQIRAVPECSAQGRPRTPGMCFSAIFWKLNILWFNYLIVPFRAGQLGGLLSAFLGHAQGQVEHVLECFLVLSPEWIVKPGICWFYYNLNFKFMPVLFRRNGEQLPIGYLGAIANFQKPMDGRGFEGAEHVQFAQNEIWKKK